MPKQAAPPQIHNTLKDLKSRLSAEITNLAKLSKSQFQVTWSSEFRREPPKGLSRDLSQRMLAWRLQKKVLGGHDWATLNLWMHIFTHLCAIELRCERPKRLFGFNGKASGASHLPTAPSDLGHCGLPSITAPAILADPALRKLKAEREPP